MILLFLSFDDLGGGNSLEQPLAVVLDWEAPKAEGPPQMDWAKQSNIIRFTSFFFAGITLPTFGLNSGCVLDPAGSSSGLSFATFSGFSTPSRSPCPSGFSFIAISPSLTLLVSKF
jgi:hypothetical protein